MFLTNILLEPKVSKPLNVLDELNILVFIKNAQYVNVKQKQIKY